MSTCTCSGVSRERSLFTVGFSWPSWPETDIFPRVSPRDSTAPSNVPAKLSAVFFGIISFSAMLQFLWAMASARVSSHVSCLLANAAGIVGRRAPRFQAACVLYVVYQQTLVELLYFKRALQILHRASLSFFQLKALKRRTALTALCVCVFVFLRFSRTLSEPFGVGVVASSTLVRAGETLNQRYIAHTQKNNPAVEHGFQWLKVV